jgi:putative salt-induced outer membrane protein YdiY
MRKGWIALVLVLMLVGEAHADKVLLKNGDQLRGTVKNVKGGVLTLMTDYSEPVKIKTSEISKISTDEPIEMHLNTGEILKGSLKPAGEGEVKVEPSSGRQSAVIAWDLVKSINPPPNTWHGNISLGASQLSGNTDRTAVNAAVVLERKFDGDRFFLRARHNYAEENDSVTNRNTFGAIKFEHFFTKKFFGYLGVELLNDSFKDLNLRASVGPGVGYQIWDDDRKALSVEAGVSYFIEDRKTGEDVKFVTGRVGANLQYHIVDALVFTDNLLFYPSIEQTSDYSLRNEATLSTDIYAGWELRFSNILEYDNQPSPGIQTTDLQWILSLGYSF